MARALEGQTAFITGGGGGIGGASAALLARDGAAVVLMGRSMAPLEESRAAVLQETPDARVELVIGDAGQTGDVKAGLAAAHALADRLDIIVATVGGGGFKPILMHDADSFRAELDINIITAFLAVRYGVPMMKKGGAIVLTSSTAAIMPFPWLAAYCTAKGGLEQFLRSAADELAGAGVRINAIRPGMTETRATGGMFANPDVIDRFTEQMPLGRGGQPLDIAQGIRFLAGPESGYMTGQSFAIDGGHELRRNPDLTHLARMIYGDATIDAVQRGEEVAG